MIGPPGSGKTLMGYQFLLEGSTYGKPSVAVSTYDPRNATVSLEAMGWSPDRLREIRHLDCYSWKIGRSDAGDEFRANPSNPSDVSIGLNRLFESQEIRPETNARLMIDSFSDFLLLGNPALAVKYLEIIKSRISNLGVTSLVMLEQGVHDEKLVSTVEFVCDGTVLMKAEETGRFIMVKRMVATPTQIKWIPFEIRKGIDVIAESFFS